MSATMAPARMTDAELNAWVREMTERADAARRALQAPAAKQAPAGLESETTIRTYDPIAQEWRTVTVPAAPLQRTRTSQRRRRSRPACTTPLSSGSPIPAWWRDTAFAEQGPLADTRTHIKQPAMRTHRPAGIVPGNDLGSSIATKPSDRLDV